MTPGINQLRAVIVGLLGVLATTGLIPADVQAFMESNADQVAGVILLTWAAFGFVRNRKDKRDS